MRYLSLYVCVVYICIWCCVCACVCACVCVRAWIGLSGYLFSQKVLRRLGHCVVSSDEDSQVKPDGPSEKAWGKRKATFYSTDFVDDELGGDLVHACMEIFKGLIFLYFAESKFKRIFCNFCPPLQFNAALQLSTSMKIFTLKNIRVYGVLCTVALKLLILRLLHELCLFVSRLQQ